MNQIEADEDFLYNVWEEVNEMVDETEDVEVLREEYSAEEILALRDEGHNYRKIALRIVN